MTAENENRNKRDDDDPAAIIPRRRSGIARGLGRGLSALFEDDESVYPQADPEGHTPGIRRLSAGIDQLEPGRFQPRQYISSESIDELAESIAVHGVLQPLLVREKPDAPGTYEIIAGERRWRAAQRAQLHEVPVIIRDLDDTQAAEIALIENLQREDLNAIEEAQGFQRLMDEFGHTQEKLAAALGKSRSHVANMVRLLNLPPSVQMLVRQDKLTAGHARALITAENPEDLARRVISQGLSVRETERLAAAKAAQKTAAGKGKAPVPEKDVDTLEIETQMSISLGLPLYIDTKGGEKGTVRINYKTLDELDKVLKLLSRGIVDLDYIESLSDD